MNGCFCDQATGWEEEKEVNVERLEKRRIGRWVQQSFYISQGKIAYPALPYCWAPRI
jgi:hypothetical protein